MGRGPELSAAYSATLTATDGGGISPLLVPLEVSALLDDPFRTRVYGVNAAGLAMGTVLVFDSLTGDPIAKMTIGKRPTDLAVTADGTELLMLNAQDGAISIVRFKVVGMTPIHVVSDPQTPDIYVVSEDDDVTVAGATLVEINTLTEAITRAVKCRPVHTISADGRLAFGEEFIFDTELRDAVLPMPAKTTASTFNSLSEKLAYDAGGRIAFQPFRSSTHVDLPADGAIVLSPRAIERRDALPRRHIVSIWIRPMWRPRIRMLLPMWALCRQPATRYWACCFPAPTTGGSMQRPGPGKTPPRPPSESSFRRRATKSGSAGKARHTTRRGEYVRRETIHRPGIRFIVEFCSELDDNWQEGGTILSIVPIDALWERVSFSDIHVAGPDKARFSRVRVEEK